MNFFNKFFLPVLLAVAFSSCGVFNKTTSGNINEDYYQLPAGQPVFNTRTDSSISFSQANKIFLFTERDTVWFKLVNRMEENNNGYYIFPTNNSDAVIKLKQHSFDIDVFTTPFKIRPAREGVSAQMNTNFNGSFYFGYRNDKHTIKTKTFPGNISRTMFNKAGYGFGGFIGLGSAFISPKFMRNTIDYEYDGLVIDYGVAFLFGYRNISTGLSLGFDFLTNKNKNNWVYQHKPWLGIFIGLNLN